MNSRHLLLGLLGQKDGGACRLLAAAGIQLDHLSRQTARALGSGSYPVRARGEEIIFLRKIVPGGADRSYGIEVAKLAGLPNEVVKRANVILKELEQGGAYQAKPREETEQVSRDAIGEAEALAAIRRAQPDTMSPIEAMQLLYELKQKLS